MNRLTTIALSLASLILIAPTSIHAAESAAVAASPNPSSSTHKAKMVHFSIRNDTNQAFDLQAGEDLIKVDKGRSVHLKMPIGTSLFFASSASSHQAGSLFTVISTELSDTTIAVH
jgi:hypothetical protein